MSTPGAVLAALLRQPGVLLIQRWNWKSALCSSLIRALLFFAVNLSSGLPAATAAMLTEFVYRALTAGFYGSITQAFRKVEPAWQGMCAAVAVLVAASHSIELGVHWMSGTPHLGASVAASICLTLIATLFNLHAMRRGVLVTDGEAKLLWEDFRRLPEILAGRS